jgi:hypothetical protein
VPLPMMSSVVAAAVVVAAAAGFVVREWPGVGTRAAPGSY